MKRDPLGRPWPTNVTESRRKQVLTDDEINVIAAEVRTKPLAEVGRHVMPLVQHIAGLDDRQCSGCRHWVPYNRAADLTTEGECRHTVVRASVRGMVEPADDNETYAVVTKFDWCCRGWGERPAVEIEAQASCV
jgi:hypothetical protein